MAKREGCLAALAEDVADSNGLELVVVKPQNAPSLFGRGDW